MRILLQMLSSLMLIVILFSAVLYFNADLSLEQTKRITLVATVSWFVVTPFWMGRSDSLLDKNAGTE